MPFFFYVAHLFLIHALAVLFAWGRSATATWMLGSTGVGKPAGYGLGLAGIYAVWLVIIIALYPACRWFASLEAATQRMVVELPLVELDSNNAGAECIGYCANKPVTSAVRFWLRRWERFIPV
mgnify:CR=1 FL=1